MDKITDIIGSSNLLQITKIDIILKKGSSNIETIRASEFEEYNKNLKENQEQKNNGKLLNIVYNDGGYYVYEPQNSDQNKYNIIDNHIWLITKFMPTVILYYNKFIRNKWNWKKGMWYALAGFLSK